MTVSRPRNLFSLFVLLILFSASGMCALIYEVVWYQMLQLAIGSTSVSLGILLATFMGGLCIGSLLLPQVGDVHDLFRACETAERVLRVGPDQRFASSLLDMGRRQAVCRNRSEAVVLGDP